MSVISLLVDAPPMPLSTPLRRLATLALLLMTAVATAPLAADEALIQRVQAFLFERLDGDEAVIEVHPPSARLPACDSPEPFLARPEAPLSGRVSVGVRCGEAGRQVRYLQAEVARFGYYPVAAVEILPGTLLTEALLEMRHGALGELPRQAVLDPEALLGQQARQRIRAGTPLQAQQFQAPALVERGQAVVVEASGAGFRVTREGEALEAGALGDRVRVRFDQREVISAQVIGKGRLAVAL